MAEIERRICGGGLKLPEGVTAGESLFGRAKPPFFRRTASVFTEKNRN